MQKRVIERIIISCYYGPGTMKRIQNSQDIFSSPLKKNDFTKIKNIPLERYEEVKHIKHTGK